MKNWCRAYGDFLRIHLVLSLVGILVISTGKSNPFLLLGLLFLRLSLPIFSLKARLEFFRVQRLLGLALIDIFYNYMIAHCLVILVPVVVSMLGHGNPNLNLLGRFLLMSYLIDNFVFYYFMRRWL